MWGGVGEFLHFRLNITESDIGQEDLDMVLRVAEPEAAGLVVDAVLVTFNDKKKKRFSHGKLFKSGKHGRHRNRWP